MILGRRLRESYDDRRLQPNGEMTPTCDMDEVTAESKKSFKNTYDIASFL